MQAALPVKDQVEVALKFGNHQLVTFYAKKTLEISLK